MRKRAPIQRGFTLVELLTVMGILGLLVMLLMPAVNFAIQAAYRASTKNTINQIETGLAGFHADWSCYPPSDGNHEFASSAKAGGGYENLGYFLCSVWGGGGAVPGGGESDKRSGPYFEGEKGSTAGILDSFKPEYYILYFRYKPAETLLYDVRDNPVDDENAAEGFPSQTNLNLLILRPGSNQYVRTDYVLISAGPDRKFGHRTGTNGDTAASDYTDAYCDDVTNFEYE